MVGNLLGEKLFSFNSRYEFQHRKYVWTWWVRTVTLDVSLISGSGEMKKAKKVRPIDITDATATVTGASFTTYSHNLTES